MSEHAPYILVSRLGEGGMAEVFKAYKQGPDGWKKPIALKRILPKYSDHPEFIQMLSAEARLHAHLEHPNIVQILDFFKYERSYMMALEYVPGRNLRTILNDAKSKSVVIPWNALLFIACEVLRGLDYAHKRRGPEGPLQIVHRDVSPQNILVSYEGIIKLSDFGIALASIDREETATGVLKGKNRYLAPEQLKAEGVDLRADVYSLGVVLYELLAGRHPFTAQHDFQTMKNIVQGDCTPLQSIANQLPEGLSNVIHRALELQPSKRFTDAAEFRDQLIQFMDSSWHSHGSKRISELMQQIYPLPDDREEPAFEKTPILSVEGSPLPNELIPEESLLAKRVPSITDISRGTSKKEPLHKSLLFYFSGATVAALVSSAVVLYYVKARAPALETTEVVTPTVPTFLPMSKDADPTSLPVTKAKSATATLVSPKMVQLGKISVNGPIGAMVYINGISKGTLPLAKIIKNLKPGSYMISIKPKDGQMKFSRIQVEGGKTTAVTF